MLASALRRRVLSPLGARLLWTRWIHAGRVSSSASASPDAAATADDEDPAGKLASDLATYARQKYRSGDRDAAAGVLEHGADMVLRVGSGPAVDAAASRARLAWALMQADAGELAHAQDTLTDACTSADASGASMDRVASHVAAALNAARALAAGPSTSSSLPDAERVMDVHLDAADTAASEAGPEMDPHAVVMRIAALGARGAAAMAAGDAAAADAASREIFERTLGPSDESNDDTSPVLEFSRTFPLSPEAVNAAVVAASDKPHGAAVAHAIKQCAQWSALNDESDLYVDIVQADALYAFAESAADAARESEHVSAAASAMYADATYADVKLGRAQLALRTAVRLAGDMREIQSGEDSGESESSEFVAEAVEEMGKRVREALATAESSAAAALTACEALGGETQKDPRVGLAVAVSGDVYTAKAVIAARTPGAGGVGDGAGIMFAEGLYRNALKMIGTPRPPTSTADDDDAAAGGAARADLRLAASVIHARYAAILKASGPQRKAEAEDWAAAAAKEWRAPGYGDMDDACAVAWAARGIGSVGEGGEKAAVHDMTLMMPVTLHNTRYPPRG